MRRLRINIIVDLAMFVAMALLSLSGWVLKVAMPRGGMHRRGMHSHGHEIFGVEHWLWREIHLWAGIAIVVLLLVHIILHWSVISAFFSRTIPNRVVRYGIYLLLLAMLFITLAPWVNFLLR